MPKCFFLLQFFTEASIFFHFTFSSYFCGGRYVWPVGVLKTLHNPNLPLFVCCKLRKTATAKRSLKKASPKYEWSFCSKKEKKWPKLSPTLQSFKLPCKKQQIFAFQMVFKRDNFKASQLQSAYKSLKGLKMVGNRFYKRSPGSAELC